MLYSGESQFSAEFIGTPEDSFSLIDAPVGTVETLFCNPRGL